MTKATTAMTKAKTKTEPDQGVSAPHAHSRDPRCSRVQSGCEFDCSPAGSFP